MLTSGAGNCLVLPTNLPFKIYLIFFRTYNPKNASK